MKGEGRGQGEEISTPHAPHPQPLSPSDAERVAFGRGGEGERHQGGRAAARPYR